MSRPRQLVSVLVLLIGVGVSRAAIPVPDADVSTERFVPRPELVRLASLGFDALVADIYWLQAVQVLGGAAHPKEHAVFFGRVIDLVTTLDPWVEHPYRFAAAWLIHSPEQVREANRLLRRGIAHHPRDWRNHFLLGFNHFFYLGELEAGAEALARAVALPGSPQYLPRLVARLRGHTDGLEVARAFLASALEQAEDPYARAEYEKALDEVETERRARILDRAREAYAERHGRDIESVEDLVAGDAALPAEPHGWQWVLDPETDSIVSSYYGHRYRLHAFEPDRERRARWGVPESSEAGS